MFQHKKQKNASENVILNYTKYHPLFIRRPRFSEMRWTGNYITRLISNYMKFFLFACKLLMKTIMISSVDTRKRRTSCRDKWSKFLNGLNLSLIIQWLFIKKRMDGIIYLRLLNDQKRSFQWRVYDGSRWCTDFANDSTCVYSRHDNVLTELLTGWIHYGSDTDDRRRPFVLLNARSVWDVRCEWMQTAVLWRYNCLFWKMRD